MPSRQQIAERDHQVDQLCGDVRTLNDAEREAAHALAALSQGITQLADKWRGRSLGQYVLDPKGSASIREVNTLMSCASELAALAPSPAAEPTQESK